MTSFAVDAFLSCPSPYVWQSTFTSSGSGSSAHIHVCKQQAAALSDSEPRTNRNNRHYHHSSIKMVSVQSKHIWTPESWREKPIKQQPEYPNQEHLSLVERKLSRLPPLVYPGEAEKLKKDIARAGRGETFILQGGDCAETFRDFNLDSLTSTFRLLVAQTVIIAYLSGKPIVKIGRIAGQFAKPRSATMENIGGLQIPSYRGDIIHQEEATLEQRTPDPERLIDAYNQSASTLNCLRATANSAISMLDWVKLVEKNFGPRYKEFISGVQDALNFVAACGLDVQSNEAFRVPEFFSSHEGLLLNYESALTRQVGPDWYCLSGHMIWIGERTRQIDGAHVEYCRGIKNPIGVKVGPSMDPQSLVNLVTTLNPNNEPGKITLITRMGTGNLWTKLPPLIQAINKANLFVTWSCDPMHENTIKSKSGLKTRPFELIKSEIFSFFQVHAQEGSIPGGIHLEMTGLDVTECIGGQADVKDVDLKTRYQTACDPRLNASQAIELAFEVGQLLRKRSGREAFQL